ncbi:MAG: hypothetical protein HZC54_19780 [Verrucomicrobia bacterium]|nr:hypothetical protein [Verrucomicrobiota bacterium]
MASDRVPPTGASSPQENPFGILCDAEMPWATFSTTATGLDGFTLAELIKPGIIYLNFAKLR